MQTPSNRITSSSGHLRISDCPISGKTASWPFASRRLQRTIEFGTRSFDAGLAFDHPVPLAAYGGQRTEVDFAATAPKRIDQGKRKCRCKVAVIGGNEPRDGDARG